MGNSAKTQVINRLKRFMTEDNWLEKAKKKNPTFAEAIENIKEDDISFGSQPTLRKGYVTGNSTASGENSYGDTTTRRTTSIDFNTDECVFLASSNNADAGTCYYAVNHLMKGFGASDVHAYGEARLVAENYGKKLCRESLSDLNFSMNEYRLNRYDLVYTSDAFTLPCWPIYADITVGDKRKNIFLGYYYTKENTNYIAMLFDVPMSSKTKLIIAGCVLGAAAIALLFLLAR